MNTTSNFYRLSYVLLSFLSGLMMLWGCTSLRNEVDPVQLGVERPKLVVTCYLSPQDNVLTAKITRSNVVVGDSLDLLQTGTNVTDATVLISDGKRVAKLSYTVPSGDSLTPYYSAKVSDYTPVITVGNSYTLTVTSGTDVVTSTCTIPGMVKPTGIKFDSLNSRYYIQANWIDPAGQTNYYQVVGSFLSVPASTTNVRSTINGLSFDDDNRGLFSDAGFEGGPMGTGKAYLPTSGNQRGGFYNRYREASVTVNLLSVDRSYYQFQLALIQQRRSRGNPFAEPVLIPSNIQGGLGCFAGYNNSNLTVRLK